MAKLRIQQITGPVRDAVQLAGGVQECRDLRQIGRAAVNQVGDNAGLGIGFFRLFVAAADERRELVLPVNLGERIGRRGLRGHVGLERMVQEKVAVVDVVILHNGDTDLPQIRPALGGAGRLRRTACTAGNSKATSTPMMAMTTKISISVSARRFGV